MKNSIKRVQSKLVCFAERENFRLEGKKIFSIIALMLTVAVGAVAQTTYTTTLKDGTDDADKWTISPTEAAEGTNVTIKYNGTKKVKNVIVTKKAPSTIPVTAIELDKTTLDMTVSDNAVALTATVTPDDATDKTVTWTTSDENVATVDANGLVTAVAVGTATIYAEANDGSGVKGECSVTVTPATTTVTWDEDVLKSLSDYGYISSNQSATSQDVTLSTGDWGNFSVMNWERQGGASLTGYKNDASQWFTFSTTLGTFTKIEIYFSSEGYGDVTVDGWTTADKIVTWTGSANTVTFGKYAFGVTKIVFTIEE